jgi:hypothetical protein
LPESKASCRYVKNKRRKRRECTRTDKKKRGRQEIHRVPSGEIPAPGTTQWNGDPSSVPNCGVRQRSRSQLPNVEDRQRWWTRSRLWLETECRKRDLCVLLSDGSDLFRDREDDMKIVRLGNFGGFFNACGTRERLARWTVAVTATVVAGPLVLTAVAPFEMISCRVIGGPHDPTWQNDAGTTPAP